MLEGILSRLYRKVLGNQLAIAVGAGCSQAECGIPSLAVRIQRELVGSVSTTDPDELFRRWNEIVSEAESRTSRESVFELVAQAVRDQKPGPMHRAVAAVPISNFIDTTFDRPLLKALQDVGRAPISHDWRSQRIGSWKQSNPDRPNLLFSLPPTTGSPSIHGVYEPTRANPQNRIQIENMGEMLADKDLLLIGVSPAEAESVLHLYGLCLSFEKGYVEQSEARNASYWAARGVMIGETSAENMVARLVPNQGSEYSVWDALIPSRKLVEIGREKQYDAFISYFSGDGDFVRRLESDLRLREIHTWRDEREIDVGDSMTDKIQSGLADSYTFVIVLSPEALSRPWVKEELRAAYAQRLSGNFKILPVLHRECEIPPFLADYRYADFRDPRRYQEQLGVLERAIRNAVRAAREKK